MKRALWIVPLLAIVGATIAAWLLGPGWLVKRAVDEAKKRGFDCAIARVTPILDPRSARVEGIACRPSGVPGIVVRVDEALVMLDGTKPTAIELGKVDVALDEAFRLPSLLAFEEARPKEPSLPIALGELSVDASIGALQASFSSRSVALEPKAVRLGGVEVKALGMILPKTDYAVTIEDKTLYLGVASIDPKGGPLRVVAKEGSLTISLEKRRIDDLLPAAPPVPIEAKADVALAGDVVHVTTSTTLFGYVPPHPKELDGILFGDKTTVDTHGAITLGAAPTASFDSIKVKAGGLSLAGTGTADAERASIVLKGSIPCSMLAASAAENDLGALIGPLASLVARHNLAGSVALKLTIEIPLANPGAAKVEKSALPSCSIVLR